MRILVTGSEGTLGRPLVAELERRGHEVFGCDQFHSSRELTMRGDVAEARQLERVFAWAEPELCFHLAAEFGRLNGEEYFEDLWRTNAIGTRCVIEACHRHGTKMIFASSSEVYGEEVGDEFGLLKEDLCDDTVILHPNEYALSKWVNERQIMAYAQRHEDFEAMRLRFFNAYGPGERYHHYRSVVALFCARALRGLPFQVYENYHRTFMFVDDFIPTLATVADKFVAGEVVNIGGTDYRSVEELAEIILSETGADRDLMTKLPEEEHNTRSKRPTIDKAQDLLGHDPQVTLEVGVPKTVEWMRKLDL